MEEKDRIISYLMDQIDKMQEAVRLEKTLYRTPIKPKPQASPTTEKIDRINDAFDKAMSLLDQIDKMQDEKIPRKIHYFDPGKLPKQNKTNPYHGRYMGRFLLEIDILRAENCNLKKSLSSLQDKHRYFCEDLATICRDYNEKEPSLDQREQILRAVGRMDGRLYDAKAENERLTEALNEAKKPQPPEKLNDLLPPGEVITYEDIYRLREDNSYLSGNLDKIRDIVEGYVPHYIDDNYVLAGVQEMHKRLHEAEKANDSLTKSTNDMRKERDEARKDAEWLRGTLALVNKSKLRESIYKMKDIKFSWEAGDE